jgi:hypothetical protein
MLLRPDSEYPFPDNFITPSARQTLSVPEEQRSASLQFIPWFPQRREKPPVYGPETKRRISFGMTA